MKVIRSNIYFCLTYVILFVLFLAVFMLGYISGQVVYQITLPKLHEPFSAISRNYSEPITTRPVINVPVITVEEPVIAEEEEEPIQESPIDNDSPEIIVGSSPRDRYFGYVNEICEDYKFVDDLPMLIMAMMEVESNFDPTVTDATGSGCIGLMQVSPYWQKDRAERLGVTDLWDEYGNILVAVDCLQDLYYNYTNEDIVLSVMMYNMDFTSARKLYNNGQWSQYAIKVFDIFDDLKGGH